MWKQLHVNGVCVVDGDHAFAVVGEIFFDDFQEGFNWSAAVRVERAVEPFGVDCRGHCWGSGGNRVGAETGAAAQGTVLVSAEVGCLFFHFGKGGSEAADDALVGNVVGVEVGIGVMVGLVWVRRVGWGVDDEAKVENEFVAVITLIRDRYGEAQNAVFPLGIRHSDEAVAKGLARDDVLLHDAEVEERRFVDAGDGYDASWRTLRDDFRPWDIL